MGYATILGLDLGKFKSVCCVMDVPSGRHAFETLASTPTDFEQTDDVVFGIHLWIDH